MRQLAAIETQDDVDAITVAEAAARIKIPVSSAYELVRKGQIPAVHLGRRVRIPLRAFQRWLARETTGGKP